MDIASLVSMSMALLIWAGGLWAMRRPGFGLRWTRDALIWACLIGGLAMVFLAARPWLPPDFGLR